MKYGWKMKLSLLSISLVLTSASAISGSIPSLAKQFPNEPLSSIELLTTIPALMVVIFVLLSGWIAKKIGAKQTVLLGLIIALICGVLPGFTDSFTLILLSRAGLGIGFGLFNSLAVSLIGLFFEGEERATLIGFQSAFQGLGSAAMTFVAGLLSQKGWQPPFYIYFIILPIIFLFYLFVPTPPERESTTQKRSNKPNKEVILWALFLFFVMIIYMAVAVKISSLILFKNVGNETSASTVLSLMSIASMCIGFIFGKLFKWLNSKILPISLLLMGIAYFMIAFTNSYLMIVVACLLVGCSFSMIVPFLFNRVNEVAPAGSETISTSLLLVGANLGSSLSPYGLKLISSVIPKNVPELVAPFIAGGILLLILSVLCFILNKSLTTKPTTQEES